MLIPMRELMVSPYRGTMTRNRLHIQYTMGKNKLSCRDRNTENGLVATLQEHRTEQNS